MEALLEQRAGALAPVNYPGGSASSLDWVAAAENGRRENDLVIRQTHDDKFIKINLDGFATTSHVDELIGVFRVAIATKNRIVLDFSNTRAVALASLGLLLMLRKQARRGRRRAAVYRPFARAAKNISTQWSDASVIVWRRGMTSRPAVSLRR